METFTYFRDSNPQEMYLGYGLKRKIEFKKEECCDSEGIPKKWLNHLGDIYKLSSNFKMESERDEKAL